MKRLVRMVLIIATVLWAGANVSFSQAGPQLPSNPHVQLVYRPAHVTELKSVAADVKKWEVLEQFGQFMVPLRLSRKLVVQFDECGGLTRPYKPGGAVTVCYELVDKIERVAANVQPEQRNLVLVGTIIQAVFHESAIAVFDLLQVPIWGREDDAADRLAAFLMVEFGPDLAKPLIIGATRFFKESDQTWTGSQFADKTSPEAQRFYNYLCIAFGSDSKTFAFVQAQGGTDITLPWGRAVRCQGEFEQVRKAFNLRIMPSVDPDLLIDIRSRPWSLFSGANP